MDEQEYKSALEAQRAITESAAKKIIWRKALTIHDAKARFPGFHQRTIHYKAGQQVESGALPLPIDLVMHESVPMLLSDKTKLYSDIFLPARFSKLETQHKTPVPAIVAWQVELVEI
jgi:uncharacterized protein